MRPFHATAALLVVLGAALGQEAGKGDKTEEVYQAAVRIAAVVKDEVWPGFDARRYFYTARPSGGTPSIAFTTEPSNLNRNAFWRVDEDYFVKHPPEENINIVFHEAFHGFENDKGRPGAPWRHENTNTLFDYATLTPRNNALFTIEGRLLHTALLADDAGVRPRVRQFLAVRKLRQAELEPRLVAFETGAESNEGLAEYVGTKAVLAGMQAHKDGKITTPFPTPDPAKFLKEKYARLEELTSLGSNDRIKFYYTGSAQGLLLDRLLPGWKGRVQEKATPVQDMLSEAVGTEGAEDAKAIVQQHDYEAVLEAETENAARRQAEGEAQLAAMTKQGGREITVRVAALGKVGYYRSYDPMNVTILDRARRLHTRMVHFAQDGVYQLELSRPVLEHREKFEYRTTLKPGEQVTVQADGNAVPAEKVGKVRFEKKLSITAPGVKVEVTCPGEIELTKHSVTVELAGRTK